MASRLVAGIDFGGTKIRVGIIDQTGAMVGEVVERPTQAQRPADEIADTMARAVREAAGKAGVELRAMGGVGVGSPGPLDLATGTLLTPPNLPTMWNYPLREELEARLGLPVQLNNDGNCFVLGEAIFGAGRGAGIVAGVTLGTGFGCGIVVDRKIFEGATGTAAEIWCCPYQDATFEEYGSARGLVRCYRKAANVEADGREIFRRAEAGETAALEAYRDYGTHLGTMLSYLVNVLDPDVIVVGGSVAAGWEFFAEAADRALRANVNPRPRDHVKLVKAALGDLAGVLGAAALALD
ncbi:MAG: ROK family protein [candidate division KSB1 bacterium]|nr:ROK family protein [candidate division KSB1 bacterium]